jgi:hypothetical protein
MSRVLINGEPSEPESDQPDPRLVDQMVRELFVTHPLDGATFAFEQILKAGSANDEKAVALWQEISRRLSDSTTRRVGLF